MAVIVPGNNAHLENLIPWCGLLIEANSLNIFLDQSRWIADKKNSRDFVMVDFSKYPPSFVVEKLLHYLKVRASSILFDRSINSAYCVRRNVKNLVKILAQWYAAYIRAYEKSSTVGDGAKRRLRDADFVAEFSRRVYDVLCRRVIGKSRGIVRLAMIKKLIMEQIEG